MVGKPVISLPALPAMVGKPELAHPTNYERQTILPSIAAIEPALAEDAGLN